MLDLEIGEELYNLFYDYKTSEGITKVMNLITTISMEIEKDKSLESREFNEIISMLLYAFENKDYVLVCDLLKYELKLV